MNFQRINYLSCDDGEHKVSCTKCLKLLPPTAFYIYSRVRYIKNVYHVITLNLSVIVGN